MKGNLTTNNQQKKFYFCFVSFFYLKQIIASFCKICFINTVRQYISYICISFQHWNCSMFNVFNGLIISCLFWCIYVCFCCFFLFVAINNEPWTERKTNFYFSPIDVSFITKYNIIHIVMNDPLSEKTTRRKNVSKERNREHFSLFEAHNWRLTTTIHCKQMHLNEFGVIWITCEFR